MHYALIMFPTEYTLQPAELGRLAEDSGFDRSGCRSTPTSRSAARRRGRVGRSCRRNTSTPTTRSSPSQRWPGRRRPSSWQPASSSSPSATRSSRRRRLPPSTTSRTAGSSSASAVAGTRTSSRTTASSFGAASRSYVSASSRCRRYGPRTRRSSTADTSTSTRAGPPEAGAEAASAGRHGRRRRDHLDRVIEFCQGWMPICRAGKAPPELKQRIVELKHRAEDAGRDPPR